MGNRIAPVGFGPRKVIIVAARQDHRDRDEGRRRIRTIAAPAKLTDARIPHGLRQDRRMFGLQFARIGYATPAVEVSVFIK